MKKIKFGHVVLALFLFLVVAGLVTCRPYPNVDNVRYGIPSDPELAHRIGADRVNPDGPVEQEEFYPTGLTSANEHDWWYIDGRQGQDAVIATWFTNNVLEASLNSAFLRPWAQDVRAALARPTPELSLEIHLGDLHVIREYKYPDPNESYFATDTLDIRLGKDGENYLRAIDNDLRHVEVHLVVPENDLEIYLDLDSREFGLPPHRQGSGYYVFGADGNRTLAWKQFQPMSRMTGYYIHQGVRHELEGEGYGDHARGNEVLAFTRWDWHSFRVGPIMLLGGYNVGKDGSVVKTLIFGTKDQVIGSDADRWVVTRGGRYYDPEYHRMRNKCFLLEYPTDDGHNHRFLVRDAETIRIDPVWVMTQVKDNYGPIRNWLARAVAPYTWDVTGAYLKYRPEVEYWELYNGEVLNHYTGGSGINEDYYPGTADYPDLPPFNQMVVDLNPACDGEK